MAEKPTASDAQIQNARDLAAAVSRLDHAAAIVESGAFGTAVVDISMDVLRADRDRPGNTTIPGLYEVPAYDAVLDLVKDSEGYGPESNVVASGGERRLSVTF